MPRGALSTSLANAMLDLMVNNELRLFTVIPDETGAGGTEATGGNYAPKAVTLGAAAIRVRTNTVAIDYGVTSAAWSSGADIVGFAIKNSSSGAWYISSLFGPLSNSSAVIVTPDATANNFTSSAHGLTNGMRVYVESDVLIPTGLSGRLVYYVVNAATNTFQVALTNGGTAVDFSDVGAGTIKVWRALTYQVQANSQFILAIGAVVVRLRGTGGV